MTTAERIRAMLVKDYKLSPDQLTDDALLVDLGIDSIGMAELIFTMEDEFGLTMPDAAVQLTSFGEVVAFIDGLIADKNLANHLPIAVGHAQLVS